MFSVFRIVTYQASSGSILSKALILIFALNISLDVNSTTERILKYKYYIRPFTGIGWFISIANHTRYLLS